LGLQALSRRCVITNELTAPVFFEFWLSQKKTRVRLWLYEDARLQIEGVIIGFDEYMNMVLDEAVEIDSKKNARQEVGRILLKGDSITMLQEAQPVRPPQEEEQQ
jgi:small nuclear ribonucleoprotein E